MTTSSRDLAQVAAPRDQPVTIVQFIERMKPEMARALPKHMDPDRMARLALTLLRKNPDLAKCTQESFGACLMTATALGLEPGVNEEAYLIPYKQGGRDLGRECTFVIGYQGYVKLFWQHPLARHIDAQMVCENDEFDYAYGLTPFLNHKPAKGDRGDIINYYAVASLSTGAKAFVVLTPDEIKALRQGRVGPDPKFKGGDPMHWMERKTAIRQLVKLLPKSVTLSQALRVDEQEGSALAASRAPQQIIAHEPLAELEASDPQTDPVDPADPVTGEVSRPADGSWPETPEVPQ